MPTRCPLCGVDVVKPEGEVDAPLPEPACPSRGLETLIHWVTRRWTSRESASRSCAGSGTRGSSVDARPLPADARAAAGARRLRRRSLPAARRPRSGIEGAAVLAGAVRAQHPEDRLGDRAEPRAPLRLVDALSQRARRSSDTHFISFRIRPPRFSMARWRTCPAAGTAGSVVERDVEQLGRDQSADRRELGIRQGDLVEITSSQGSIRVPAFPSPGIAPDVVAMPVGQGMRTSRDTPAAGAKIRSRFWRRV